MIKSQKIIRAVAFTIICGVWLGALSEVFKPKYMNDFSDITRKIGGFYAEEENELDFIFFGSSRMYSAANPAVLWQKYGITSYDFCANEQTFPVTLHYIEEALKHQTPKAVVVDISFGAGSAITRAPMLQLNLAHLSPSLNKLMTIKDSSEREEYLDYLFSIRNWHSYWYSLTEENFEYCFWEDINPYRGYSYVEPDPSIELAEYDYPYDMEENMKAYCAEPAEDVLYWLDQIVDYTQEKGVELVLIAVPDGSAPEYQSYYNGIFCHVADEENVTCINYNLKMTGMNHLTTDLSTEFTEMLGEDLLNLYDVEDKRNREGYESWDETGRIYDAEMKSYELHNAVDWEVYTQLVKDDNYDIYMQQQPWLCSPDSWNLMQKGMMEIGVQETPADALQSYVCRKRNGAWKSDLMEEDSVYEDRDGDIYYRISKGEILVDQRTIGCGGGVTIVIYDKKLQRIVDIVSIVDESLQLQHMQ